MCFLGLGLAGRVPDCSTTWRFGVPPPLAREALVAAGAIEELFAYFDRTLIEQGHLALGRQLIDPSIVEAPRQRLTTEEKQVIRFGKRPDRPAAKARHKHIDAPRGGLLTAVPLEVGSSVCRRMTNGEARPGEEDARADPGEPRAAERRPPDPGLRHQEPHQHRPALPPDPQVQSIAAHGPTPFQGE